MLRCFGRCCRVVGRVWQVAQVELSGEYSTARLLALRAYCARASTARCLLVLVLTPLPCLLATLLIECFPLRSPSDGIEHSLMLWVRTFWVMFAVEFSMLQQCRSLVPTLPTSPVLVGLATVVVSIGATAGMYAIAVAVGFPLPFSFLASAPVTVALMLGSMLAQWGRFLAENRAERWAFICFFFVIPVQVGLACAYPAYAFVFNQLSAGRQVAAMALLPVIKVLTKNVLVKICRDDDDVKPLVVVLNAEIYHVLFFSWCMNGATSKAAVASLALVDVLETAIALFDIKRVLAQINSTVASHEPLAPLVESAAFVVFRSMQGNEPTAVGQSSVVGQSSAESRWPQWKPSRVRPLVASTRLAQKHAKNILPGPRKTSRVCPHAPTGTAKRPPLTSESIGGSQRPDAFLHHVLRLLFLVEFVLLVEYTEVMTPILYSLYLHAAYFLPNRAFLSNMRDLSPSALSSNTDLLLSFSLFELASLVAFGAVLKRVTRLSALPHLAFVLESHWQLVQAKLLSWVVFTVQTPLKHYGTDYSFRFDWLTHGNSTTN